MTTLQEEYGEAITRCVCGDDSDESGFMIQCDTEGCRVWQHADCVGLTQETVPDKYYCERCQPDHQVHVARRQLLAQTPRKVKGRGGKTKPITHKKKGLIKQNNKRKKPRSLHEDELDLVPPPSPSPAPPSVNMKRLRTRTSDAAPSPVSRTTSRPSREDRELQKQLEKFSKMESSLLRPNSIPAQLPSPSPSPLPQQTIQKGKKIRVVGRKSDTKEPPPDTSTARGARARVRALAKTQTKPRKLSKSTKNNNRPRPPRPPSPGKSAKVSLEELAWERRKERPLAPMYLGRKQWLLRDYRNQQERTHCDYHRRYMDAKIPIKKRILLNFLTGKGAGAPKSDNLAPTTEPPRLPSTNKPGDLSVKPRAKIPRKNSVDQPLPQKKTVSQKSSGDKTISTVTTRSGAANSRQQQKTVIKNNKIPSKGNNNPNKRQKGLGNHIQPSNNKSGNAFNLPSRSDLTVRSNFVSTISPLAPNSNPTTTVK